MTAFKSERQAEEKDHLARLRGLRGATDEGTLPQPRGGIGNIRAVSVRTPDEVEEDKWVDKK